MDFSSTLIKWYAINKRELPWRNTKNPYFIWISEIILQQTRVIQGEPYYLKFIETFPTIDKLAYSDEKEILRLWQGLGYYSRARNMHFAAKFIVENYSARFPNEYDKILNLKGVGTYTAAAISSFAFGLPHAVLDGNVFRVLSRVYGIDIPIDTTLGKKKFSALAQSLLDKKRPALNNQAIMEFGATQCTHKLPKCDSCPFTVDCIAYNTNSIHNLPLKLKKVSVKKRYLNYFFLQNCNRILLGRRDSGIWQGLYELPHIEFTKNKSTESIINSKKWNDFFKNTNYKLISSSQLSIHKLSHQHIYARFWTLEIHEFKLKKYEFVNISKLIDFPIPRLLDKFLKEINLI